MKRSSLARFVPAIFVLFLLSTFAWSDDTSMLKAPKGSKVAILVFEDLQCPLCARAAPMLHEAAAKYNVPLVQYDFPLPMHPWSYDAAVNARFFDSKSPKLGDEYRLYIFQNQTSITKASLRGVTEKWAEDHKITMPFVMDPQGEFAGKVDADRNMGKRIPLEHTPTVFIVNDSGHGQRVTEVKDPMSELYQTLDKIVKEAGPATAETHKPATTAKKTSAH
jgi:protein-disulfide isomerase